MKMKIFMITGGVPFREDKKFGVTAINIQLYQLIRAFLEMGHEIVLQIIFDSRRSEVLTEAENEELESLEGSGVTVLPAIFTEKHSLLKRRGPSKRLFYKIRALFSEELRTQIFYPAFKTRDTLSRRIRSTGADAIFIMLSPEGVASTYGFHDCPKIVFQGDLDFHPDYVRMKDHALFAKSLFDDLAKTIRMPLRSFWISQFKEMHIRLMCDTDAIVNATAVNAEFYRNNHHPRSVYAGTTWKDLGDDAALSAVSDSAGRVINIIGHVGSLGMTGSTYGLKFLLSELVPALKDVMQGLDYNIHIIGGGSIAPRLGPLLKQERVVVHGFVKDLDTELRSGDVFVFVNNAGRHLAAYSRHIIAWSMGLCLIVHARSRLTIPEIEHMKNALVGQTAKEIAEMIRLAATDKDLNMRIRRGGRETYERHFTPSVLAGVMANEALNLIRKKR